MRKITERAKKLKPAVIQKKGEAKLNKIGSRETEWVDSIAIFGVLGGQSGDSKYTNFNAKIEESTHVYICDFDPEVYTPGITADWRAQMSMGMNLQYNSWIWGTTARIIYDQDPIGPVSDGFVLGTGVSYDLLRYSLSLTYMFSDTGVWHSDVDDFRDNMLIVSFRYKYSENVDGWISGGTTSKTPFISAGLRLTF